jgi:uncharacterized protein
VAGLIGAGWLIAAFAVTALLYASIGFGGGSTYTAVLALADTDYQLIAPVSQMCNIIVVTGGIVRFGRAGLLPWRRALILSFAAAPVTYLAARVPITQTVFLALLSVCLFVTGLILLLQKVEGDPAPDVAPQSTANRGSIIMAIGAGALAGFVGIGGGIFLAPYLHLTRWARAKEIAATASLFILINALAGLAGHLTKLNNAQRLDDLTAFWPLLLAVIVGGSIGSHLAVKRMPALLVRQFTALLILFVAGQIAWRLASL